VVEKLNEARLNLLVILYKWMTKPGSTGFLEERAIPDLPASLPAVEIRALLQTATAAGWMRRDLGISISDTNLPKGIFWEFTAKGIDLVRSRASEDRLPIITTSASFSSFCDMLLVALADHATQQATKFDAFDLRAIAELYNLQFTADWIYLAGEVFTNRQWAKITHFSDPGTEGIISAALTGPGLLEAERLRKELLERGTIPPTYPPLDNVESVKTSTVPSAGTAPTFISSDLDVGSSVKAASIPAADRFVTRADNAPLFEDADKKLQAVIDAIPADNELRVSAEDRLLLVREVKDIKSLINQPRVQLRAIYHATRESSILVWFAKEFASGVVQALAAAAVTALLLLLAL
jgi:hypothetical protein